MRPQTRRSPGVGSPGSGQSTNLQPSPTSAFLVARNPDEAADDIATALGGHVIAARWIGAVSRALGRRP